MGIESTFGETLVSVEGAGKRYRLGEEQTGYEFLAHRLEAAIRAPFRWIGRGNDEHRGREEDSKEDHFWALRDVSFEIRRGETLGLIGRNGAGKSTMLKLLSRITLPTEGRIVTNGRIATLLEVGTGFHPELTGRENVFMNGTILGMRRSEIEARFDEIVEFSGVERFLDTPVKRYSSGMYVRLAFAIAAHLDPEIMLVDEVLAVGDTEFQKKCLGRIRDVSDAGRAVVFVSHNLTAVQRLCDRVILLEDGRVAKEGETGQVLTEYFDRITPEQSGGTVALPADYHRSGAGGGRLLRATMENSEGTPITSLRIGQPFRVKTLFEIDEPMEAVVELGLSNGEGSRVATLFSTDGNQPRFSLGPGMHEFAAVLAPTLIPGDYLIDVVLHAPENPTTNGVITSVDVVERVLRFTNLATPEAGEDPWPIWKQPTGYTRPGASWQRVEPSEPVLTRAASPS